MHSPTTPLSIPRRKSRLSKWAFWSLLLVLAIQFAWLFSIPLLRHTLKLERATPRSAWLEWPSEIDIQAQQTVLKSKEENLSHEGPQMQHPVSFSLSRRNQITSIILRSAICWPNAPSVVDAWNIRIEMAVILSEAGRFLSTTRGSLIPIYSSKKLSWQNPDRCEPVTIHAEFFVPEGKQFYGYILRLIYKDKLTWRFSEPVDLVNFFPFVTQER